MFAAHDLIEMINQNRSIDYWYDDRLELACNIFKNLDHKEFSTLLSTWQNRSDDWNLRFATVLNCRECAETAKILSQIIGSENYLTASIALTELAAFESKDAIRSVKDLNVVLDNFDQRFCGRPSGKDDYFDQIYHLKAILISDC
ncbi:MAG: hypothetical protein EOP04_01370 [Proteobacteria bacterium]|nr:MAG: hypothetical protein EOP04_01370 [Pseudomonadota bacterium]